MKQMIIKYIVENNQLQNWTELEDGSITRQDGFYFSCNYFRTQDLLNDMCGTWPNYDEETVRGVLVLVLTDCYDGFDLEKALEKLWNDHSSSSSNNGGSLNGSL